MTTERLQQDLDYVARTVRRHETPAGIPAIYFMWAIVVAVGWALPDFAPTVAAPYWVICGIGGGVVSWWVASRDERARGARDKQTGLRWGLHWLVGGAGFVVCWLPALHGAPIHVVVANFMLVAGLVYALAGVHLERPLLWTGLLMLLGYVVLSVVTLPYTWTITGLIVAAALVWAGVAAQRQRRALAK